MAVPPGLGSSVGEMQSLVFRSSVTDGQHVGVCVNKHARNYAGFIVGFFFITSDSGTGVVSGRGKLFGSPATPSPPVRSTRVDSKHI